MSDVEKDELIEAQKQVIGILFEIIKKLQANNDLDEEYFQIVSSNSKFKQDRLNSILTKRAENSEIVKKLLQQLET